MISRSTLISIFVSGYIGIVAIVLSAQAGTQIQSPPVEPIRKSFYYNGNEREYFVWFPKEFDPAKIYWALVVVHGGGPINNGLTFWMTRPVRHIADELGLQAIVISPSFDKNDPVAQRYPAGVEGQFLEEVLHRIRKDYHIHPRILLTGYSRGAQFAHRYALWNPEQVEACAPFASGAWTTPDGRLLDPTLGEVKEPNRFLTSKQATEEVPQSLQDPRVAKYGGLKAKAGAKRTPFLVMCGSLDERFEITREFAKSLSQAGYKVETKWPRTPHVGREEDELKAEFEKFPRGAVEFFLRVTETK